MLVSMWRGDCWVSRQNICCAVTDIVVIISLCVKCAGVSNSCRLSVVVSFKFSLVFNFG